VLQLTGSDGEHTVTKQLTLWVYDPAARSGYFTSDPGDQEPIPQNPYFDAVSTAAGGVVLKIIGMSMWGLGPEGTPRTFEIIPPQGTTLTVGRYDLALNATDAGPALARLISRSANGTSEITSGSLEVRELIRDADGEILSIWVTWRVEKAPVALADFRWRGTSAVPARPDELLVWSSAARVSAGEPVELWCAALDDNVLWETPEASWSVVSGPGPVTFQQVLWQKQWSAQMTVPGTYVLRLTRKLGERVKTADVTVVQTSLANSFVSRHGHTRRYPPTGFHVGAENGRFAMESQLSGNRVVVDIARRIGGSTSPTGSSRSRHRVRRASLLVA
jgi:hypothetical protein